MTMKKTKGKATNAAQSKPLCDCPTCKCKKCPDVVKLLSISLTDSKHSKSKMQKCKEKKAKLRLPANSEQSMKKPSILDILKDRNDCNCEVVAKAVQSNVHMNLGLADKREECHKEDNTEEPDNK